MKKTLVNSQLCNFNTYQMYLRRMLLLAENVFKINNLPEDSLAIIGALELYLDFINIFLHLLSIIGNAKD